MSEEESERSDFQFGNKDEDYGDGDIIEADSEPGAESEGDDDDDVAIEEEDDEDDAIAQTVGFINDVEVCRLLLLHTKDITEDSNCAERRGQRDFCHILFHLFGDQISHLTTCVLCCVAGMWN